MDNCAVIDLFCGIGGLSHGFIQSGFRVVAGIDNDQECRYAYEYNNHAQFISKDVAKVTVEEILALYPP
ncbi:MAG: DNA cytosine methyltransferase, partial [Chloroflexota bacterium]|nr:DNA cytosine methyltransferase [Chloroflexota bacterium]